MNKKSIAALALVAALATLSACGSEPAPETTPAPVEVAQPEQTPAETTSPVEPFKSSVLNIIGALAEIDALGTPIDQNALNTASSAETAIKISAVLSGNGATFMADVDGSHCMVTVADVKDVYADLTSAMCAASHADAMTPEAPASEGGTTVGDSMTEEATEPKM